MHDSNPRYGLQGLPHSPRRDSWIGTSRQEMQSALICLHSTHSVPVFTEPDNACILLYQTNHTTRGQMDRNAQPWAILTSWCWPAIIIFATDQTLHRLTASTIYMDGTFKACPKLFYQLFSIHIFIEGVQFPALYALLPGKSRDVYSRFFMLLLTKLQDLQLVLQPTRILTDFELAQVQSVQLAFPTSHIAGCYYHYQQCIWRWVSMKGHTAALAFVPPEHVRLAWGCLQMKFGPLCTNCPPALDFSNYMYFKQTWMTGSFPISMWNHHTTTEERTNNHLEGWHYRFNTLAGKPHPNIYQLIHLLQREDGVT